VPITPFHFGPGGALHAIAPRHISFLAFCAANVVIDAESLYNLVHRREPVHAFLHTYVGATLVWLGLAVLFWLAMRWPWLARRTQLSLRPVALGALLGAYSHVLLDSVMHHDIQPLAPFAAGNALQGLVSLSALHLGCVGLGLAALAVMTVRWLLAEKS